MNKVGPGIRARARELFNTGMSVRQVSFALEIAKETAHRLFPHDDRPLCACGKPVKEHRGWCRVRFARSLSRQRALLQAWGSERLDLRIRELIAKRLDPRAIAKQIGWDVAIVRESLKRQGLA